MAIVATAGRGRGHGRRLRRRADRPVDRRVRRRRVRGPEGLAGAARRDRRAAAARDRRRRRATTCAAAIPEIAQIGVPVTEIDGWHFELETARQTLLEQLRVQQPRRLRPRAAPGGGLRRPARWCGTCATRRRPTSPTSARIRLRQSADGLLIDPTTLKHLEVVRGDGRRPQRVAARRDRSHGHADGRPAAARLAAAPAGRARADPRSARRRRGARLPDDRARQGCARR